MKKIVLTIIVLSSLSLSLGWFLKPKTVSSKHEQMRLEREAKLLCIRYTKKLNQYSTRQSEDAFFLKATRYFDTKVKKYCKV